MAQGRKTGGRQRGTPNKKTLEMKRVVADAQAKAIADGITPLEYMLAVMRDDHADRARRDWAAAAAANYVHPKLASTQIGGDKDDPLTIVVRKFAGAG